MFLVQWPHSFVCQLLKSRITLLLKRCCSSNFDDRLFACLNDEAVQNFLNSKEADLTTSSQEFHNNIPRTYFSGLYSSRKELLSNLQALKGLQDDKTSKDLSEMIVEEEAKYKSDLKLVELELLKSLAPPTEDANEITVEIIAGVGGKEAALFSNELFEMYCNYANFKNWNSFVDEVGASELGGIRHAKIYIEGPGALKHFIHESGVHRVQRVPATEKSGRVHTSTAAVAVLPQTTLVDVKISEKDIVIDTMRATGAGGQHVNKTDSAVRITHLPSGLVVECQEDRSQIKNRQTAMKKLKMRLNQIIQKEQDEKIRGTRKSQVGTSARSDKVRTYNFPQDRISDHRLSKNIHNVPGFLKGEDLLDATIEQLIKKAEEDNLSLFLQSIMNNKT
ncbi:unnamed protein product [Nesidiocoris tenuis]|uniref:Prokaryotic-type class I peptide chain release factors domain-containing protein n=1 Tax=Nesidiocoris tenuis TaxID=355587 RepID=A0A6H5HLH5_9HEMI|nr:unnamed protein product [Nesidiocoris tenuis]